MLTLDKKEAIPRLLTLASTTSADPDAILLAYLFSKQAYLLKQDHPVILEKLANNFYKLKDYSHALQCVEKWFALSDTPQNNSARMYFLKGMSLFHLGMLDSVQEVLSKAVDEAVQPKDNDIIVEAKTVLEEELSKAKQATPTKSASQKREECEIVKGYFDSNELPDVPRKMVYIIPGDWLEKWKSFNNYYEFTGDNSQQETVMEEEREKIDRLGPIDPSNILIEEPNLIDPDKKELYTNYQIKYGLEENKDFFFANERLWNYLYTRYGGIPVQRPTYRKAETQMNISIEVWLQKINVILLPLPSKTQPPTLEIRDTVYISKRKTMKDLIAKLIRIYSGFFDPDSFKSKLRLWKIDPRFDIAAAWKDWEQGTTFEVQGKILNEDVLIEDAELSEEDTIVFEIHYLKHWFLVEAGAKKEEATTNGSFTSIKSFPTGAKKGLTGLQNLGNTCFMNSAIQCLSNTFDLTTFFLTDEYKKDVNKNNPLGSGGKLAFYYSQLMKEMWLGTSSYVSPWELKKTIGKLASQFVGYGQQDSQELLSYLLDGLHEDLNRIVKKPFIETKDDDNRPDEIVADETWNNHLKRNQSKIQELMHGQFKSRLDCPDCHKISITFDPYMMLSLPIPSVDYIKFFMYFVFDSHKRIPLKITFNVPNNTLYPEIVDKLIKIVKLPRKNIIMGLLKDHKLVEFVSPNVDAQYLKDHPGILFAYELPAVNFSYNQAEGSSGDASTTVGDDSIEKMEAENEGPASIAPESLARVFVQAEPKAFYESEKTISYTRLLRIEGSDTYRDVHLKIYDRLRPALYKYFEKEKLKNPINIDEKSKDLLEKEYNVLFPEDGEGQWIYKVYMVNPSRDDAKNVKKVTCELCQKGSCKQCILPYEDEKLAKYLQKMGIQVKDMLLEVKIASKTVKLESLPLNQCTEYRGEENDIANPNRNYTIYDCLDVFTRREKLEKDNAWFCSRCKSHKEALKKMEIYKVPPVLIMHLKRFKTSKVSSIGSYSWSSGKKLTTTIEFPIDGLDLRKYVLGDDKANAIYDLYAVSNHYGSLSGGHYTAYAKNQVTGNWHDFNDSRVSQVSHKEVVSSAAYVLFYKRRNV